MSDELQKLCEDWYETIQELWPLMLGAVRTEGWNESVVAIQIATLEQQLRPVIDGLATAAERCGIDSTPLWNLAGNLEVASDEAWNAAWVLVKRLETVSTTSSAPGTSDWSAPPDMVGTKEICHSAKYAHPETGKQVPPTTLQDWKTRDNPDTEVDPQSSEVYYPIDWVLECIKKWRPRTK